MIRISKIYSTLAVFVIIDALIAVFVIYPVFSGLRDASGKILYDKQQIKLIYQEKDDIENFKNNLSSYRLNLDKMEQMFIDPQDPLDFIKFVESTAATLNIDVDINLVNSTNQKSSSQQFSYFQINAKGGFLDVLNFIQNIENGPYLLKVNNLSVSKSLSDVGIDPKASVNMTQANIAVGVLNKYKSSTAK